MATDAQGNIWIGTDKGGVVKIFKDQWTIYNTSHSGIPSNKAGYFTFDDFGNTWIGSWGGGVSSFNGDSWFIGAFTIDDDGNKWIGTSEGLAFFDGVNWKKYNTENSDPPENNITALAIDGDGKIWIATYGGGLAIPTI